MPSFPKTLFGLPIIWTVLTKEPEEPKEMPVLGDFMAYITWKLVPPITGPLATLADIQLFYYDPDRR